MSAHTTPHTEPAPVGTTVHILHRLGRDGELTAYHDLSSALAALAASVRPKWHELAYRDDVPASPDGLSDAEVVFTFYRVEGDTDSPSAPLFGITLQDGFTIVERTVAGPEPAQVPLRLATVSVLDSDPDETGGPAVTYRLNAAGLTLAVSPGPDGFPSVLITPDAHMAGLPFSVHAAAPARSDRSRHRVGTA
ncbi:hypothetical protein NQK81_01345 [Amycolatopsis roodepoortensis]|uniref:hypothetical protein n=1 Tax=Amycolatopsis roodepoortensis TaxID=700274 RepID=UPI00214CA223|nr:hypothetical protein [Amycolatopsis roodepoortensis]UUV32120.1 hypothetical protein NQK81_01345 [Amycolatopsis roodepoortensis]